jgi:hypothetical protein
MIWEYTQPEARLIQPAWHEVGSNTDNYYASTILRPAGPFSSLAKQKLGSKIIIKEAFLNTAPTQ